MDTRLSPTAIRARGPFNSIVLVVRTSPVWWVAVNPTSGGTRLGGSGLGGVFAGGAGVAGLRCGALGAAGLEGAGLFCAGSVAGASRSDVNRKTQERSTDPPNNNGLDESRRAARVSQLHRTVGFRPPSVPWQGRPTI